MAYDRLVAKDSSSGSNRLRLFGGVGLIGLLIVGFAVYWFMFRDTSAESVDTAAAAEARQEAIEERAAELAEEGEAAGEAAGDTDADDAGAAVDTGQPDSAASIGSPTDGVWTVDTSIGTFNDACLTEVCGSVFAGFRIDEELAGIGAKTVVGRTPGVSGSMELSGNQVIGALFEVDMTGLVTDSGPRTDALRSARGGLETDTFPTATFELIEPITFSEMPVEGASVTVDAVGDLTVHGVTNRVTIPLTAEMQAGVISVFGTLEGLLLSDYNIPTPTAAVVVSVEDNAALELQLFLTR